MRPETAKYLSDIRDSLERIVQYTAGMSREAYLRSPACRDAVHWNFAVIGEAIGQLHDVDPRTAEQIREWKRIIAFRNQLIHGYGVIRSEITWDIITTKVPLLRADVQRLLADG